MHQPAIDLGFVEKNTNFEERSWQRIILKHWPAPLHGTVSTTAWKTST